MTNSKQDTLIERWLTRAAILIVVLGFGVNYIHHGLRPYSALDMDESCWISCTYYYDLVFRKKDLRSNDWTYYDCIDHPPLMKFALGAYLSWTTGFAVHDLELRDKWDSFDGAISAFEYYREHIPINVFTQGRLLTTIFMIGAGITLTLLVKKTMSSASAFMTAILFTASPLIRFLATYTNADSLLIFLSLLVIGLQIKWIHSVFNDGHWLFTSVVLGVFNGMVFNTKISGVIMLATAVLSIVTSHILLAVWSRPRIRLKRATDSEPDPQWSGEISSREVPVTPFWQSTTSHSQTPIRKIAFAILLMSSVSVLSAIAINPSLYRQPFTFVSTMFAHRLKALEAQQAVVPQELTFPNATIRLGSFALMTTYVGVRPGSMDLVLFGRDWERMRDQESVSVRVFRDTIAIGTVFLFFAGLIQYGQLFRCRPMEAAVMGINIASLTLAAYYSYQLNVPRYLGMAVPFLIPIAGLGFSVTLRDLISLPANFSKRIARIILTLALTLNTTALAVQWNIDEFLRWYPNWPAERMKTRRPTEEFEKEFLQIHSRVQKH